MIESENIRNIIKVGKRVERIDLLGRLRQNKKDMLREDLISSPEWKNQQVQYFLSQRKTGSVKKFDRITGTGLSSDGGH